MVINPLPDDKIVALFKWKAFADDNINSAKKVRFFFDGVENVVGKGEITGYQHFLLFPQCLKKYLSPSFLQRLSLYDIMPILNYPEREGF